jgi:Ca2+-binding EF-hand superfamily protein
MTKRNFEKELCYSKNIDMENGNDTETIDYQSLFSVIAELCDRIEKLERITARMKLFGVDE